jgi:hypothetical protein
MTRIVAGSDSGQLQRSIYEKPLKNKTKTPYLLFQGPVDLVSMGFALGMRWR